MATYLGVEFPNLIYGGNWLRTECENTAADYHLSTEVPAVVEDVSFLLAASADTDNWTLDQIETALWQANGALSTLLTMATVYRNWLNDMLETGNFGLLGFGTEETCGQRRSTMETQWEASKAIYQTLFNTKLVLNNRLASVQALQQDEIDEEQIQNDLNEQINLNNEAALKNQADLTRVQLLEFLNNLQVVIIPLLIISTGVAIWNKRR